MKQFDCKFFVLIFICLLGSSSSLYAQLYFPEDMVNIKGQIIDELSKDGIGYAHVLNLRVRGGTMADASGNFSIQADPQDTLIFKSLNYKDKKVPVSQLISQDIQNLKVLMAPIRILIDQVEVKGEGPKVNMTGIPIGKSVELPVELRSNYFDKNPTTLTAIFRPMSYLSYKLSKSEKEKRTAVAIIHSEKEWQILSLVYNKEVVQRISGLQGEALEDFMLYCNAFSNLPTNANSYDVEKRVRELLVEYRDDKKVKK